ncbi:MAG TPA: universal stress protein [Solirubrobacteraceae bacterium]|nr:universal stress protein [Solirubrobacteraceae bacterium]
MAGEPGSAEDAPRGPVLFAYDGSELSKRAIEEAGRLLGAGRDALVLVVWQPFDVAFVPSLQLRVNAADIAEVRDAAQQAAEDGAALADAAGFRARAAELETSPTWKGIVHAAEEHDASVIVIGSHGRTGLSGVLLGSVAEAVSAHSHRSVLIVHRRG